MHPILFQLGNFKIYSYGVMVAIGFLTAVYLAAREARRRGMRPEDILDILLYAMLFGIIGARALHVILEINYYSRHPLDIIMINQGGLAFQGGLFLGILAAWLAIKRRRLPLLKTADIIAPYVALAQSIGRIGCFLNGCCYGIAGHPTQIYLSLFFLAAFIILKKIYERNRIDGAVFALYLAIFSLGSFLIDFLRGDLAVVFLRLRISQFICLAILFFSLLMLARLTQNLYRKDKLSE